MKEIVLGEEEMDEARRANIVVVSRSAWRLRMQIEEINEHVIQHTPAVQLNRLHQGDS